MFVLFYRRAGTTRTFYRQYFGSAWIRIMWGFLYPDPGVKTPSIQPVPEVKTELEKQQKKSGLKKIFKTLLSSSILEICQFKYLENNFSCLICYPRIWIQPEFKVEMDPDPHYHITVGGSETLLGGFCCCCCIGSNTCTMHPTKLAIHGNN